MNSSIHRSCTARVSAALILLAFGCSTRATLVVSRADDMDLSQYSTWSWVQVAREDDRTPSEAERRLSGLVQYQIRRELYERGFRYRPQEADLGIDASLSIQRVMQIVNQRTAVQTLHSFNNSPSVHVQATEVEVAVYQRGRLTIRVTDLRRDRVVWTGIYKQRFRDSIEPHVSDIVVRTLADFPSNRATGVTPQH